MKVTDLDTKDVTVIRTEKRYVLNEKVFDLDSCPDWAQYAATDECGTAYWHEDKPCRMLHQWFHRSDSRYKAIGDSSFDATDWQNSLIKRPEKVDVTSEAAAATSSNLSTDVYKLDTQVFLLDRCPSWAKWAAVDHDGIASWYSTKPVLSSDKRWQVPRGVLGCCMPIERVGAGQYMRFDASSYYDSAVEKKACLSQAKARKDND